MTRYTKRQREQAALICAIAASNSDIAQAYGAVCSAAGIKRWSSYNWDDSPCFHLAIAAWKVAQDSDNPDAEAEALIRTGWTP